MGLPFQLAPITGIILTSISIIIVTIIAIIIIVNVVVIIITIIIVIITVIFSTYGLVNIWSLLGPSCGLFGTRKSPLNLVQLICSSMSGQARCAGFGAPLLARRYGSGLGGYMQVGRI